jgi:capsular polysaccharide biosynthesis protein
MDDTVHTAEDMEKYFGITPLTVIPDIAVVEDMESKKKKRK